MSIILLCLFVCLGFATIVIPANITPVSRLPRGSSVSFDDDIPKQLMEQFQRNRYNVSMYLYQLGKDNVCRKMLIYQVLGDPRLPVPRHIGPQIATDSSQQLVVLIHGFNSNSDAQFPKDTAEALCQRSPGTNVIVVDWRDLAFDGSLLKIENAVNYVVFVAGFLTQFLVSMNENEYLDPHTTYLIGHSLGSYIAAYAARGFQNLSKKQIQRITVLDPPLSLRIGTALNFNRSDASYIDSVRTSWLTKGKQIGHVDFFVNPELLTQPGCGIGSVLPSLPSSRRRSSGPCSHSFAHIVFLESILYFPRQFTARKCPGYKEDEKNDWKKCLCPSIYITMGYDRGWFDSLGVTLDNVSGVYNVETNGQSPFAKDNCPNWGP